MNDPPEPNWYTVPSGWVFTLFTNDTEQLLFKMQCKVFVLFLITAQYNYYKQTKKNEYIHGFRMLTSIFKLLQYGSWLAMTERQSLDYRTRQKVQNETHSHSISVQLKVCLWTTCKSLLLHIGCSGINTVHVMASVNTSQHHHKGHDQVSVFFLTYLQSISMAWCVKVVYKQTLKLCWALKKT